MATGFHIVLRDKDGFESLDSREFELDLDSTFPIGRSSSAAIKPHLAPATHNAYINSAVISREHAFFSANTDSGLPEVFITDKASMHGTMVNQQRLEANTPKRLSPGDEIQFGIDVNRNEEFHIARRYIFDSRLIRPFSMGFTVPDSEDEDMSMGPRRGSQTNPVTIDASDSESEASELNNDQQEEPETVSQMPRSYQDYPLSAMRSTARESFSDDEVLSVNYPSDEDALFQDDSDGAPSDEGEIEPGDDEDDAEEDESADTAEPKFNSFAAFDESPAPQLPSWASFIASPEPERKPVPVQSVPRWAVRESPSRTAPESSFPAAFYQDTQRPSAATSSMFGRKELPSLAQHQGWGSEDAPAFSVYRGTNHGDRPALFGPAPGYISTSFAPIGDRMLTPSPAPTSEVVSSPPPPARRTGVSITEIVEEQPPTPTSVNGTKRKAEMLEEEVETPATQEPVVSPVEIEIYVVAEDAEDVGDAPVEISAAEPIVVTVEPDVVMVESDVVAGPATVIAKPAVVVAQRSIAQPRSIIKRLKNTASYLGYGAMGAAGAIALLTAMPETFFAA